MFWLRQYDASIEFWEGYCERRKDDTGNVSGGLFCVLLLPLLFLLLFVGKERESDLVKP